MLLMCVILLYYMAGCHWNIQKYLNYRCSFIYLFLDVLLPLGEIGSWWSVGKLNIKSMKRLCTCLLQEWRIKFTDFAVSLSFFSFLDLFMCLARLCHSRVQSEFLAFTFNWSYHIQLFLRQPAKVFGKKIMLS